MSQPIWDLVIEDMRTRDRLGEARYGVRLHANSGRDALQDAYEEALDLSVYLRQEIFQRETAGTFQEAVHAWLVSCFGAEAWKETRERNHRFLEEALELVQACGATASEAHQLVDYVFGRPTGVKEQELGGTMTTLAALCKAHALDMDLAGSKELVRCWKNIAAIRAKQAAKPKHLPQSANAGKPVTVSDSPGERQQPKTSQLENKSP